MKSARPADPAVGATAGGALAAAARALADAGCETPRLDAEVLLAAALQTDRAHLVIDRDEPLDAPAAAAFEGWVARRAAREPVAYILGRRDFRRLTLCVDPRVLIPRPETELLVEVGLGLGGGTRVADVGTGSGAVALALADERPDLWVCGSDVSADALAVARSNAARLALPVEFVRADLLDGVPPVDAVLANLPYVEAGAELAPEIARFEPAGALFAGADGVDLVRRLVGAAAGSEVEVVALEIAPHQAREVAGLVGESWGRVEVLRDLAGRDRVVVGRR